MLASWRLYACGAVLLLVGLLVVALKVQTARLKSERAHTASAILERDQAKADYAAYKKATEADERLNRKTREALQTHLSAIERERAQPAPRLRCYASRVPSATASSGAATGANDAASGSVSESDAFDPAGPALDYAADAARCAATLTALQEWERGRR